MDDFLGGMFDFNGDGETDDLEAATGFAILDEFESEDEDGSDEDELDDDDLTDESDDDLTVESDDDLDDYWDNDD